MLLLPVDSRNMFKEIYSKSKYTVWEQWWKSVKNCTCVMCPCVWKNIFSDQLHTCMKVAIFIQNVYNILGSSSCKKFKIKGIRKKYGQFKKMFLTHCQIHYSSNTKCTSILVLVCLKNLKFSVFFYSFILLLLLQLICLFSIWFYLVLANLVW